MLKHELEKSFNTEKQNLFALSQCKRYHILKERKKKHEIYKKSLELYGREIQDFRSSFRNVS